MNKNILKFEGVNFNKEFWKGKKESDFLKHESHHGLTDDQLKEAFARMNPFVKEVSPPEKTKTDSKKS